MGSSPCAPATVACVMRSGGVYSMDWAWALNRRLRRFCSLPFRFRVLTDHPSARDAEWGVPLERGWPGWWSKLELFRPGALSGPVLYLDLDTLVVGDVAPMLEYRGPLALISDFYRRARAQSGAMAFTPGPETEQIWRRFEGDAAGQMRRHRGDGEFIRAQAPKAARLQTLFPGLLVSLKVDARHAAPRGAAVVCGHGQPRLSSPSAGWAHREWRTA